MAKEKIIDRLSYIVSDISSLTVSVNDDGSVKITVDMHGYGHLLAKKVLREIILMFRNISFEIVVIHGYNSGTVLLETIRNDFENERIVEKKAYPYNPGITSLFVKAA